MKNNMKIAFWGSSNFSIFCLEKLKTLGILPNLIITAPDARVGRGLILTPNPVKIWAGKNNISCLTPAKIDSVFTSEIKNIKLDLALVASYGKIISQEIIDLPRYKTLNIHPSLLPKYRGPSPLQEQIINDEKDTGVTIMLMDKEVDHGPIIGQKKVILPNWPVKFTDLEMTLANEGTELFNEILNQWIDGKITPITQNHSQATFTKKVKKEDGLIDIKNGNAYKNYLKILAYNVWPQVYFFINRGNNKTRVIIKDALYKDNQLEIIRVLPEGRKEMLYKDFLLGIK